MKRSWVILLVGTVFLSVGAKGPPASVSPGNSTVAQFSEALHLRDSADATYRADGAVARDSVSLHGRYLVVHQTPDGHIDWMEQRSNLLTTACRDYLLDISWSGAAATTTWYLGLKNIGAGASTDTASSHAGWTEYTNYSESVRQTWTEAGVSGQKITNSASPAVVTISGGGGTVGGVFLISNNTKGGTTGTLCSIADFATARVVTTGTLTISYELTS
jgi:hypothetical protein